ncbi:MAG: glycoside hydrolase family 25 protein [Lachnospiraceae bacterium]|nr:glycoside hydrolase family 25 protein [Lachnospiraceae bacterium]
MTLNESETENVVHEPKVKKNRMTKIIFYIMAILLTATTALSIYTTYNMNILRDQMTDVAAMDTSASASSGNQTEQINIPDYYTLISNEQLEAVKNDSYYLGRDNLLESIRTMMENGDTTLRMLRALYPEQLIYVDSSGYIFKDINKDLAMNDFEDKGFNIITEGENGIPTKVEYYEDDKLVSYTGIDVSKHNGTIDWAKVKAAGIDFAMIRVANRGYGSEGKLLEDDMFEKNAAAANQNKIPVGVYIFSEAITVEEALEEANLVISKIEPYDITYPVVIDIEEIAGDSGRNESLTPAELTDIVLAFCNRIKDAGYTPMLYCNLKGFIGMLEFERLEGIEKWYAYYGDELYFPYDVSIWQYSSSGTVDGINGTVDLNISFKNYEKKD